MKRNIGVILLFSVGFIFSAAGVCFAGSAAKNIKEGNRFYHQGKFDDALRCYNKALTENPDSAIINFNTGAALYRKKAYSKAAAAFAGALAVEDPALEAKASYNMGNSKYRMGKLKENTDSSNAVSLYKQALEYYRRAIELDQKNTDAKYNYEFVEKELKALLDKLKHQKQKKQQQQKKQRQPNGQKQNKQQAQQSKSGEQKQQQAQSKAEQQQKKGGQKQEVSQQPMQEEQGKMPKQEKQQAQPMQGEQKEMSEQEARMILKRCEQQELSASNAAKNKKRRSYPPVLKDW